MSKIEWFAVILVTLLGALVGTVYATYIIINGQMAICP